MTQSSKVDFIKKIIAIETSTIRIYKYASITVISLSVVAAALIHPLSGPDLSERLKWLLSICSMLLSSVIVIPLKDIPAKKSTIATLEYLQLEFESLDTSSNIDPEYRKKLEDSLAKVMEKRF